MFVQTNSFQLVHACVDFSSPIWPATPAGRRGERGADLAQDQGPVVRGHARVVGLDLDREKCKHLFVYIS